MQELPSKEEFIERANQELISLLKGKYSFKNAASMLSKSTESIASWINMAFHETICNLYDWLEKSEE